MLFADHFDADARHNGDLVAGLVERVVGEAMGRGWIETILSDAGIGTGAFEPDDPSQPIQAARCDPLRADTKRSVTGERTVAANANWLGTLADAPGDYLKARLGAAMDRRRRDGETFAEEGDR